MRIWCERRGDHNRLGIAEFERDLIRERTGAGREAARKRGVRFGRPRKLSLDQEQLARLATIYRLAQVQ